MLKNNNNLHIVRNGYKKTETEVKQVVEKRKNKKRYLYPLPVSLHTGVARLLIGYYGRYFFYFFY